MAHRPLSPHLSIYRFAYTMALSILHRATGLALSIGLLLLVAFLLSVAGGADAYARFAGFTDHGAVRVVIAGFVLAFCYHLANGIRHLFWDVSWGIEKSQARRSAVLVVAASLLLAALLCWWFLLRGSAA